MKSILMSIKPEWVAKILNGEKTIEIRKTAPKCELPIEVYIYCTKGGRTINLPWEFPVYKEGDEFVTDAKFENGNGKVVAKFTLRMVAEFVNRDMHPFDREMLLDKSCLTDDELNDYIGVGSTGYRWLISDLQIFDKPKELSEFYRLKTYKGCYECPYDKYEGTSKCYADTGADCSEFIPLKCAPKSWMYVEVGK